MSVVLHLDGRVYPAYDCNCCLGAILTSNPDGYLLPGLQTLGNAQDIIGLQASKAKRLSALPLLELQGQHPHTYQVGAMDPLIAFGNGCLNTQKVRPFGGPVPGATGAVLFACQDHQGHPLPLIT